MAAHRVDIAMMLFSTYPFLTRYIYRSTFVMVGDFSYHWCATKATRIRGVARLDGARGKKQVWRPMFESQIFRKQFYSIEEYSCDIVGIFGAPHSHSAPLVVIRRPVNCAPLPTSALRPWQEYLLLEYRCDSKPTWGRCPKTLSFREQRLAPFKEHRCTYIDWN